MFSSVETTAINGDNLKLQHSAQARRHGKRFVNEAYLNNPENATIFVALHRPIWNGSSIRKYSKDLRKKFIKTSMLKQQFLK